MQVKLGEFVGVMREVADSYPQFAPYSPDVRIAELHDTPAKRLTCEIKMMIGREPNNWSRSYFVRELDGPAVEVLKYDLSHALRRDIGLLVAMSRVSVVDGDGD